MYKDIVDGFQALVNSTITPNSRILRPSRNDLMNLNFDLKKFGQNFNHKFRTNFHPEATDICSFKNYEW
jgi:hypothetical protein